LRSQQGLTLEAIALQSMKRVEAMFMELRSGFLESKADDRSPLQAAAVLTVEHERKHIQGRSMNDAPLEVNERQLGTEDRTRLAPSQPSETPKELESHSRHIAVSLQAEGIRKAGSSLSPARSLSSTRESVSPKVDSKSEARSELKPPAAVSKSSGDGLKNQIPAHEA